MSVSGTKHVDIRRALDSAKLLEPVRDDLVRVEAEFERQASSGVRVIDHLARYLRSSGGKRLRPALLLLAYRAAGGGVASDNVLRLATVMEMLHTATLVHDDIIDNASTRRGKVTINAKYGNQTAVLLGDWLYMSAFETALGERSLAILDILTELTRKMTEGELTQLTKLGRTDITMEEYFDILQRKTAFMFSACCEVGAILADASVELRTALKSFGLNLGTAFQLADDMLDFTSRKEIMGKAAGADLIEGKLTLPLLLYIEKRPDAGPKLERIMIEGIYEEGSREALVDELDKAGAIEETRRIAMEYADKARKNLELLPQTRYRVALEGIPALMINRSY